MDPIKEAFAKAKQDIDSLRATVEQILQEINEIKRTINKEPQHIHISNPIDQHILPALQQTQTSKEALYSLKPLNSISSSGNRGVPTDRQTDQQTDNHTQNPLVQAVESVEFVRNNLKDTFLNLTKQEREVFLAIYDLENNGFTVDYSLLANQLKLTESSIRDYTLKIIKKGVPLQKRKEKNKKIILSVAYELKKIASREAIQSLYNSNQDNRYTEEK